MNYKLRVLCSSLIGFTTIGTGMALMGLHLTSIIQLTSVLIVGGFSIGLLFIFRNSAEVFATVHKLLFSSKSDTLDRTDLQVLEALEHTNLMGAMFGAFLGLTHAAVNFNIPALIGPSIAVSLVCLLYGFLANSLLIIPLKQSILWTEGTAAQADSVMRNLSWTKTAGIVLATILVTSGFLLEGANFDAQELLSSALVLVGPIVTTFFTAKGSFNKRFGSIQRYWLSDAFMSGSVIAAIFHTMVIMQNLTQGEIVRSQIVAIAVSLIVGFIGTLGLRNGSWVDKIESGIKTKAAPYFAYSGMTVAAIALCAIEVLLATHFYG